MIALCTLATASFTGVHAQTSLATHIEDKWKVAPDFSLSGQDSDDFLSHSWNINGATFTPHLSYTELPFGASPATNVRRGGKLNIPLGSHWSFYSEGSVTDTYPSARADQLFANHRKILAYDIGNGKEFRFTSNRAITVGFGFKW
jgi:hypothetical protein